MMGSDRLGMGAGDRWSVNSGDRVCTAVCTVSGDHLCGEGAPRSLAL